MDENDFSDSQEESKNPKDLKKLKITTSKEVDTEIE